jgi:membrane associated rhomboid family serine protease
MIPLKDSIPTRTVPFVTISLIAVNCVLFIVELLQGEHLMSFVEAFGAIPYEVTTGVDTEPLIFFPVRLTVISSMFLHGGWSHLLGNMLYLWIFGNNIEDRIGHCRFILFYLIVGIAASVAQIAVSPFSTVPLIGASGAISGILGAYLLIYPRAKVLTLVPLVVYFRVVRLPAFVVLGIWIVLQIVNGFVSLSYTAQGGVAFFAHIGGFIAGLALIKPFHVGRKR